MRMARSIRVRGIVQGVGFRPFVYRMAHAHQICGWVLNGEGGVEIHAEGEPDALCSFLERLRTDAPAAAAIDTVAIDDVEIAGFADFTIRESERRHRPTVRISPDLPVCAECLR